MGKISKRYSSSSFHPIWAKLYDKSGSHDGIKSYGIYWRSAKCKIKIISLRNFNTGVNGKILNVEYLENG